MEYSLVQKTNQNVVHVMYHKKAFTENVQREIELRIHDFEEIEMTRKKLHTNPLSLMFVQPGIPNNNEKKMIINAV